MPNYAECISSQPNKQIYPIWRRINGCPLYLLVMKQDGIQTRERCEYLHFNLEMKTNAQYYH